MFVVESIESEIPVVYPTSYRFYFWGRVVEVPGFGFLSGSVEYFIRFLHALVLVVPLLGEKELLKTLAINRAFPGFNLVEVFFKGDELRTDPIMLPFRDPSFCKT